MQLESNHKAASVRLRNLRKSFPGSADGQLAPLEVLGGIDLDVDKGEFVSFFGPNGCGKTTFLTVLAGLQPADDGTVAINSAGPEQAHVGFIFQNYRESLYPWLRNLDNVAFPLELQGVGRSERREKARQLLDLLGLNIPLDGYPYQLSGGQQQLLSIARALIFNADVLVMDEPFASLDYSTRFSVRDRVQEIGSRPRPQPSSSRTTLRKRFTLPTGWCCSANNRCVSSRRFLFLCLTPGVRAFWKGKSSSEFRRKP